MDTNTSAAYVQWFRHSSPYINQHRGCTFVIHFSGAAAATHDFANLVHDIALLNSLGVRLVLVPGARHQIEQLLQQNDCPTDIVNHLRVTDKLALQQVQAAVGRLCFDIQAQLSMGLANSPMAGSRIKVVSGNFVVAKPLGIIDGVDYQYTGRVRRIDRHTINQLLSDGNIVLLPPLGYSPSGEVFNVPAEDVASAAASALNADKLLYLLEESAITDEQGQLISVLSPAQAKQHLVEAPTLSPAQRHALHACLQACEQGVKRAHILNRHLDGALLIELFTRDGQGNLIAADSYEQLRDADNDDVAGILELIAPLEEKGILIRRSRAQIERDINHYIVIQRDGMIIGCAALYPYPSEAIGELACVVIHPQYQGGSYGDTLLQRVEHKAKTLGLTQLVALTTQTSHWFLERGFSRSARDKLPKIKQNSYNLQRNSQVLCKLIG